MKSEAFLTDVKTLRERARHHIENGAVTPEYKADREVLAMEEEHAEDLPSLLKEIGSWKNSVSQ